MVVPPRQVLNEARAAAKAGDYALATERYERFFDRALLDQSEDENFHGVRLSYCLIEWARVGERFPPARERLEAKAVEVLAAFEATQDPASFRDYQAILERLGQSERVMRQFIRYHESNRELALLASRAMWDRLVEAQRWDLCAAYLGDPDDRYRHALRVFDGLMEMAREYPDMGGERFVERNKERMVRDVGNLLRALRHTQNDGAAERIEKAMAGDLASRGYPDVVARIGEWVGRE